MNQEQTLLVLKDILIKNKVSYTKARENIFLAALKAGERVSVAFFNNNVEADRVSVYRNINLFVKLNILKAVNIGWKNYYELGEMFKPHHHHLICSYCHKVESIEDDELEKSLSLICKKRKFKPSEHIFEVHGVCNSCQEII
jgi:Fe2+ or Zn2+ uptake regulation protein